MRVTDFLNLPTSVHMLIGVLGATSILGGVAAFHPQIALIIGAGLVVLALVVAAFFAIRRWLNKRRGERMTEALGHSSRGTALGANAAKLDELRKTFADGLAKFGDKKSGQEKIYKFPWYVIVGEPGGGKTQAIIHCGVDFPPGLHDGRSRAHRRTRWCTANCARPSTRNT